MNPDPRPDSANPEGDPPQPRRVTTDEPTSTSTYPDLGKDSADVADAAFALDDTDPKPATSDQTEDEIALASEEEDDAGRGM